MLDLVAFLALFHEGDCLCTGQLEGGELQVLFANLLHFRFDCGEVFFGKLGIAEVDVIVEAVFSGGAVSEIGMRIQALDRLRQDVRGGVAKNMDFFFCRALLYAAIVVENLHWYTSFAIASYEHTYGIAFYHGSCGRLFTAFRLRSESTEEAGCISAR